MDVKFNFEETKISENIYQKYLKKLEKEVESMKKATKNDYDDERCSINLPFDETIIKSSKKILKQVKDTSTIIVVGIGGSNLGTIAIYEALMGKRYNQLNKKQVYFADTVDSDSILEIKKIIQNKLKQGEKVLVNAISKSGGTTETIANFKIFYDLIKRYDKNFQNHIVITTVEDSPFYKYAIKKGFNILTMPNNVGGRYSVFSNVGVFPLMYLGVDIKKIFKGAKDMRKICLTNNINKNPTLKSAISIYEQNKKGKNIFNTFLFSTRLESFGKWYRQLLGESIGKVYTRDKKKINSGITPTTAIGSTDLHSMAQLFLAGPNDKFHCFINVEKVNKVIIPKDAELKQIVSDLMGKKMDVIMGAIYGGVIGAFQKKKRSFYEINLAKIDEYNIGALLQMKMMEMMYLGALFNINPFDQPNVEEYKLVTKGLLKKK